MDMGKYKYARQAMEKAKCNMLTGIERNKKREFKSLWIQRINGSSWSK